MLKLPQLTCRKCGVKNPLVYFAPVSVNGKGTCICFNCAESRNWLDVNGNIKKGVTL